MFADARELSPIRLRDASSGGSGSFLAVRGVSGEVFLDGPLARTRLIVTFHNDLGRTLEGDLVFPLPPSAALRELSVTVGQRKIEGRIRARDRAQAEYTRAVAAGKTATLGETEGEDLARLRVAPIEDGEDVAVTLGLVHALLPVDDGHRLVLPLTYMPRFVEGSAKLTEVERAAVDRPRPLTVAARADVTIHVRAGENGTPRFRSTSHETKVASEPGGSKVTVGPAPLDRDLILEVADRPEGATPSVWVRHDPSDGPDGLGPTTAVALVPPAFADEGPVAPRTVTFLVDRSGSMGGRPMQAAIRAVRGALRSLGPQDLFNVIAFDDNLCALATRPVRFADQSLKAADAFIASIGARGGTNASRAIAAALGESLGDVESVHLPEAPKGDGAHRLRVVVFMTDGDVGSAAQVLETARAKLVDTRLHVLGIGDAVNHAMLSELATLGGGTYLPVATDEDLERALTRLKNATLSPLWTGIKASLDDGGDRRSPQQAGAQGPLDLFAGQPALFAFRGRVDEGTRLVLEGQRPDGEDLRLVVPLRPQAQGGATARPEDAETASITWALLKNRRLGYRFDPTDDATLEGLGTTFGIVNRRVALVGVHAEDRGLVVEGSVPVSLPLPRNVAEDEAVFRSAAFQPASAARLRSPAGPPMPYAPPPPQAPPPPGFGPAGFGGPPGAAPPPPPRAVAMAPSFGAPARGKMIDLGAPAGPPFPSPAAPSPARPALPQEPVRSALTADEAGLRTLLLSQGADGLFDGSLASTALAVAALVTRGHTSRAGLFRAELRRTLATLETKVATLTGDDRALAMLALALLSIPIGKALPADLPAALSSALAGLSTADLGAARVAVRSALAVAPVGWRSSPFAAEIARAFQLA